MIKEMQLRVSIAEERSTNILLAKAAQQLSVDENEITGIKILRKSIDARKKK